MFRALLFDKIKQSIVAVQLVYNVFLMEHF